jgi:protein TonB
MFAGIVAFHIVLVYFLASGLARTTMHVILQPFEGVVLDEPTKHDPPPPPPPDPMFQQPREIDLGPLPVMDPIAETDTSTALSGEPTLNPPPVTEPVTAPAEPIHLVGRHQLPNTEDYYPPSIRRLGVEGAANVRVCVDERGKRVGDPVVTESSGNARLDEGALSVARDGRYARSARGETFVPNCYGFRIIFKMK